MRSAMPFVRRALELLGVCGFAVAVPLFELYARSPDVFIAARSTLSHALVLVALWLFIPPLLAGLVQLGLERVLPGERARDLVNLVAGGVLGLAVARASPVGSSNLGMVGLAVVIGFGVAWILSIRSGREIASLMSVVPLGLGVHLLFFSSAATALSPPALEVPEVPADELENTPPVVVVVLDELPVFSLVTPQGEINTDLFPGFGRLAEASTWYPLGVSNATTTVGSLPLLVSGEFRPATPTAGDVPTNILSVLSASGYVVRASESTHTSFCTDAICVALDDGASPSLAELLVDSATVTVNLLGPPSVRARTADLDEVVVDQRFGDAGSVHLDVLPDRVPATDRRPWLDQWGRFLDGIENAPAVDRPEAFYLHATTPHIPWRVLPDGQHYSEIGRPDGQPTGTTGADGAWASDELGELGRRRHLLQLGAADAMLDRTIEVLEDRGVWDDALVVVTADHGASFEPNQPRRWIGPDNAGADANFRVPLFVKAPGQVSGDTVFVAASSLDIAPTIYDWIGLDVDVELAGLSLLSDEIRERSWSHTTISSGVVEPNGRPEWEAALATWGVPDATRWPDVRRGFDAKTGVVSDVQREVDSAGWIEHDEVVDLLSDFDASAGVVPAFIDGVVDLEALAGLGAVRRVDFVLNDRYAGRAVAWGPASATRVTGLLDIDLLAEGQNSLAVHVEGSEGEVLIDLVGCEDCGGGPAGLVVQDHLYSVVIGSVRPIEGESGRWQIGYRLDPPEGEGDPERLVFIPAGGEPLELPTAPGPVGERTILEIELDIGQGPITGQFGYAVGDRVWLTDVVLP